MWDTRTTPSGNIFKLCIWSHLILLSPFAQELYASLLSRDILTAPVLTRLMAVSIQQNLVTEPITRLLECVFYGKCIMYGHHSNG